jgi:hypothetical protein
VLLFANFNVVNTNQCSCDRVGGCICVGSVG